MLVRVPSRTMFDHGFGHHGPAKLIDKSNHDTMLHRTIQESTREGQEAEVVVSEKMNRRGRVSRRLRVG